MGKHRQTDSGGAKTPKSEQELRRAAALRENLRRRKAQTRRRQAEQKGKSGE